MVKSFCFISKEKVVFSSFEIKQNDLTINQPNSSLKLNYLTSKNYYANRYKLSSYKQQDQNNLLPYNYPVEKFQILSKQSAIPQAYSASFTSFYDIIKPKPAIIKTTIYKDDKYSKAKYNNDKNIMINTYLSNELYFQRTSA